MARDFRKVFDAIVEVAPEELKEKLETNVGLWAPEILWHMLTEYVNKYLVPSSQDENAIAVYAILCDCSKDEMKVRFEADGL